MTSYRFFLYLLFGLLLMIGLGCDPCDEREIVSLIDPIPEDALDVNDIDYNIIESGITCLNSSFFTLADTYPSLANMRSDIQAQAQHSDMGDFMAAAIIVENEQMFSDLKEANCLTDFSYSKPIDWSIQSLLVTSIVSKDACDEQSEVSLKRSGDTTYLFFNATFEANSSCNVEIHKSILVNTKEITFSVKTTTRCDG